jgi:hypothetical protein
MHIGEVMAIIGSFAGMFFWSRSESREDNRRIESLIAAIDKEMKDFHGRLCAIEERKKIKGE